MSPSQGFEIFFLITQVIRNSTEAFYALTQRIEDIQYKYIIGFSALIIAFWFLTALLDHDNIHPISQG